LGPVAALSLGGERLHAAPNAQVERQVAAWQRTRPADAAALRLLAGQPTAEWFGDWNRDVRRDVAGVVGGAARAGAVPVLVAYNIPNRDCGSHSAGGARNAAAYRQWIQQFAAGIGDRRAVVILEPDALPMVSCLSGSARGERVGLIGEAVALLARPNVAVYIDAGHSNWIPAAEMAQLLRQANVAQAAGFALNVSNFETDAANIGYGERLSPLVGGKRFVIDSSRNGRGPTATSEWCNPSGRALGRVPTTQTGHRLVDAFLWIKRPGESDGTCGGGPAAGEWWPDYALGLAQRSQPFMTLVANGR
jgi:endoglucanase